MNQIVPSVMVVQDTSHLRESNPRPTIYETVALPTELRWPQRIKKSSPNIIFLIEKHKDKYIPFISGPK